MTTWKLKKHTTTPFVCFETVNSFSKAVMKESSYVVSHLLFFNDDKVTILCRFTDKLVYSSLFWSERKEKKKLAVPTILSSQCVHVSLSSKPVIIMLNCEWQRFDPYTSACSPVEEIIDISFVVATKSHTVATRACSLFWPVHKAVGRGESLWENSADIVAHALSTERSLGIASNCFGLTAKTDEYLTLLPVENRA